MLLSFRKLKEKLKGLQKETYGLLRTDLPTLLASAENATTLGERIQWLEDLLNWIRIPSSPDNTKVVSQIQAVRVKFFLQVLERNRAWKKSVSRLFVSVLLDTESVSLLCETGLNTSYGFFAEASERLMRRILPTPRNERNLSELFSRIFVNETDADWLEKLDDPTLQALLGLLYEQEKEKAAIEKHYIVAVSEALIILASHLESLGLSSDIRLRSHVNAVRWSAFYRLRMLLSSALEDPASGKRDFESYFQLCREEIASAFAHLEEHGVSVAIVYRLEKMEKQLTRLEHLVSIHFTLPGTSRSEAWKRLLADLVRSRIQSDRISMLIQHNMHMLARKIVERTGETGEHYITSSRAEYFRMLLSATGGGLVTVATAQLKYVINKASPALFFEGFFSWLNYSGSFILMQVAHFTLATKQPSMTATALAAKLKESQGSGAFADLVARITRSQFAAALGNIGMAIPAAFAADFLVFKTSGSHLITSEYARNVVESLHPWESATIPYAIITGIVLWLSSIGGGWAENWFVYRRLPETITQSRWLGRILGQKRSEKFSTWICKNVAGLGGNLSLGFLLAYIPILGRFFGLPFDVRHVTLSTVALTLAFCALPVVTAKDIILGVISISLIGLLNFGVSFAAALFVAIKAREVKSKRLAIFRRAVWSKILRDPLEFFFPIQGA